MGDALLDRARTQRDEMDRRHAVILDSNSRVDRGDLARWIGGMLEEEVSPDDLVLVAGDGDYGSHYDLTVAGRRFHTYKLWEGSFHGHEPHLWWLRDDGTRWLILALWNFLERHPWAEGEHRNECEEYHPRRRDAWWRRLMGATDA